MAAASRARELTPAARAKRSRRSSGRRRTMMVLDLKLGGRNPRPAPRNHRLALRQYRNRRGMAMTRRAIAAEGDCVVAQIKRDDGRNSVRSPTCVPGGQGRGVALPDSFCCRPAPAAASSPTGMDWQRRQHLGFSSPGAASAPACIRSGIRMSWRRSGTDLRAHRGRDRRPG